jgi:SAM-dependent methyltransferase
LLATAYGLVSDPVSLAEEPGQVATADRLLAVAERFTAPGSVLDVGAWTGSLLVAATERGWRAEGVEPSRWAVGRARDRSLTVHLGGLEALGSAADSVAADAATRGYALVTCCDVLEHFYDPGAALGAVRSLLAPGGLVAIVGPDAGSRTARVLGRRWWSVLPMHPQYFTRASMGILLRRAGFEVCALGTHPKAFSARYYAERLGGYAPTLGRLAGRAVAAAGLAERLVAPDFGDRMLVIARLVGSSTADAGHDNGSGTA